MRMLGQVKTYLGLVKKVRVREDNWFIIHTIFIDLYAILWIEGGSVVEQSQKCLRIG